MNIDYEAERPKLNERRSLYYSAFNSLNRRRIDLRPLQKRDIIEELGEIDNYDKALWVIETIDSAWLERKFQEIKRRNRMGR